MSVQTFGAAPIAIPSTSNPASSGPSSLFARLFPANTAAKEAFHEVARRFREEDATIWNQHPRNYTFIDTTIQHGQDFGDRGTGSKGKGTIEGGRELWTGHYFLDFEKPPMDPRIGWVLGTGDYGNGINAPELLLGVGGDLCGTDAPLARLVHEYRSGALAIIAPDNNTVVLDGVEEIKGCRRLLHKSVTSIEIVNRRYLLKLEHRRNNDYRKLLDLYKTRHVIEAEDPSSSLVLVPSETDQVLDRYVVKNAVGVGSTCMVHAGYDRITGETVAVKKFRSYDRKVSGWEKLKMEGVKAIGRHPGISWLLDIIDPNEGDPDKTYVSFGLHEVYFISSPLATCTVREIIQGGPTIFQEGQTSDRLRISREGRFEIFRQLLDGLEHLHQNGIMHRDIKPGNLAVVLPEPPTAFLIDFGHASPEISSMETNIGTSNWCAPEIWSLRDRTGVGGYDNKVDIFSFGLSMYQLLCTDCPPWDIGPEGRITVAGINEIHVVLDRFAMHDRWKGLLKSCVEWEPQDRPTAAAAAKAVVRKDLGVSST